MKKIINAIKMICYVDYYYINSSIFLLILRLFLPILYNNILFNIIGFEIFSKIFFVVFWLFNINAILFLLNYILFIIGFGKINNYFRISTILSIRKSITQFHIPNNELSCRDKMKRLIEEIDKTDWSKLKNKTYYTLTHDTVINRLKNNSNIKIVKKKLAYIDDLKLQNSRIFRCDRKKCKEKHDTCPIRKSANILRNIYLIKFKVI